ncbi:MAG: hypothetical protein ACTTHM_07540 [Peptoanaerobacter stomatis]|uniref:hypothetical protein n=1 Tax=Peptoanaerobacter stomatis TaxID=796937 RepID=UPI003FA105EE
MDIDFDKILKETIETMFNSLDTESDKYNANRVVISIASNTCKTMLEIYHQHLLANLEK